MFGRVTDRAIALWRGARGATTVEWLGLATIAILVIALLLPQVRATAGDIWSNVASEFGGFFG